MHADDDAFEDLDALLIALAHLDVHADGISGFHLRPFRHLRLLDQLNRAHCSSPSNRRTIAVHTLRTSCRGGFSPRWTVRVSTRPATPALRRPAPLPRAGPVDVRTSAPTPPSCATAAR